jgi:hypothetical protein
MPIHRTIAAAASMLAFAGAAHAAPFTYQGRLTENGQPANGTYNMTFQLASSASGGFALAVDTVNNVNVVEGVFTAEIDFPSDLLNDSNRWMSITVDGTILSPRVRLRDTPRAQNAVRANAAGTIETPLSVVDTSSTTVFEVVSTSSTGTAILGRHFSTTGTTPGVRSSSASNSSSATGLVGEITSTTPGGLSAGVRGINNSTTGAGIGVYGTQAGTGWGVYGNTPDGRGVYGFSFSGTGLYGASTSGTGIFATHFNSNTAVSLGTDTFAVDATNTAVDGAGTAIRGRGGRLGIQGISDAQGFGAGLTRIGVQGIAGAFNTAADFIVGVQGTGQAPANGGGRNAYGLYGTAQSGSGSTGYGVYGTSVGQGINWAGFFQGNVHVLGTLSKSSGSFKIDHPLEPETKYLSHSFVESPDMMNIYNGVITLDENGNAAVELPHYFEALNRTFRYQLTPIGAPMPNLYIASEVSANSFAIAGGKPHARVSWEITGVRQDPSALANPIIVEEDKPAHHHGKFLDPAAHGYDDSRAIHPRRQPADH